MTLEKWVHGTRPNGGRPRRNVAHVGGQEGTLFFWGPCQFTGQ